MIAFLLFLAIACPLCPVDALAAERSIDVIQAQCASDRYRCGDGTGSSQAEAREAARVQLVTSIRALVTPRQSSTQREDDAQVSTEYTSTNQVVSLIELQGLEYRDFPEKNGLYRSIAFVEEASITAGMRAQRQRIRTMIHEAQQAEAEGHIDDALRLGYWAYLLCHTVDTLQVEWGTSRLSDPRQTILEHISDITRSIELRAEPAVDEHDFIGVPLQAFYKGVPARLDLSLYTGAGMDYPHLDNGRGYIELHWDPTTWDRRRQTVNMEILYVYEGKMRHYPDIETIHSSIGAQAIDTYVEVEIEFPFVPSAAPAASEESTIDVAPPVPVSVESTTKQQTVVRHPHVRQNLARIRDTAAFLRAIQAYAQDKRLSYTARRPAPSQRALYMAVVAEKEVLGVYRIEKDGYLKVDEDEQPFTEQPSQWTGAYRIWISALSQ